MNPSAYIGQTLHLRFKTRKAGGPNRQQQGLEEE